jgi:formate hydrogenlyase subunit 4
MEQAISGYIILLITALFVPGIIIKVKSFWAGRTGPPITQPLYDILKLLRKSEVVSETATPAFRIFPALILATTLCATLFIPVAGKEALFYFHGDFIVFAYLLATSRFLTVVGSLDAGSSFQAMGASREVTFSALMEPAFFIIMASLGMLAGIKSFSQIPLIIPPPSAITGQSGFIENIIWIEKIWWRTGILIPALCGGIVLLFMIIVEASRMPVDDPNTHLELTMIHEVMVLDMSGPALAMIHYNTALKITVFASIISILFIPAWIPFWISLFVYLFMIISVAIIIGTIESAMARLRMTHVPQFIVGAASIALLVLLVIEIMRIRNMS